MMMRRTNSKKAVAPVLATLLMIAVAVAMSVIIFMWSQGFLSQTSTATGGQQGAQNQAAQSSIAIEDVIFNTATNTSQVIIRNVGAVSVNLGSMTAVGTSSNSGFTGSDIISFPLNTSLAKGVASIETTGNLASLTAGDVVTIKVTTTVGTFAQATFTVP